MDFGNYELHVGIKEFVVISLGFLAFLGILIFASSYITGGGPQFISQNKIGNFNSINYNAVNGAFVLASANPTAESASCDIFVSTPSKHIRFLQTITCGSMNVTKFSTDDMLVLGNGEKGMYMLIVYSNETSEGKVFSLDLGGATGG